MVRGRRVTISRGFKVEFCIENNSMEFLLGPITWRINVLYESQMKWTLHHSKLAVEEVSFFGGLRVVLLQLLSIYDRAVGVTNLGVMLLWIAYVAGREGTEENAPAIWKGEGVVVVSSEQGALY